MKFSCCRLFDCFRSYAMQNVHGTNGKIPPPLSDGSLESDSLTNIPNYRVYIAFPAMYARFFCALLQP